MCARRTDARDCLRAGDCVELHSLQAKPHFNGKSGTLVAFKTESGRWQIDLDGGDSVHVKGANLTKIDTPCAKHQL